MSETEFFVRKVDDEWVLLDGAFVIEGGGSNEIAADPNLPEGPTRVVTYDRVFPAGWGAASTPEDRATFGIVTVEAPPDPPAGHQVVGDRPQVIEEAGVPRLEWVTVAPQLADVRATALERLAGERWLATQFFTFDDVRTQADGAIAVLAGLLALRNELGVPPEVPTKFKLGNGQFRLWDKPALLTFGAAVSGHIQACFDIEDTTTGVILAATSAEEIQAVFDVLVWP